MSRAETFTAAVRRVLEAEPRRDNMRDIARQAITQLPSELITEAAITYLTQLTRRVHNEQIRANGTPSAHSEEIVWTKEGDKTLGETTDTDRDWLSANRESLAAGLHRRAEHIRQFGNAGHAVLPRLSSSEVIRAERHADSMVAMLVALRDLLAKRDEDTATRIAEAKSRSKRAQESISRYRSYAQQLREATFPGPIFRATRRAILDVADLLQLEEETE